MDKGLDKTIRKSSYTFNNNKYSHNLRASIY